MFADDRTSSNSNGYRSSLLASDSAAVGTSSDYQQFQTSPSSSSTSSFANDETGANSSTKIHAFVSKHRKAAMCLLIFLVLSFIVGLALVTTRPDNGDGEGNHKDDCITRPTLPPTPNGKLYSFADTLSRNLTVSYARLSWSTNADDSYIAEAANGDILLFTPSISSPTQPANRTLIPRTKLPLAYDSYTYNSNYDYFLFRSNFAPLYRHSGTAQYAVFNVKSGTLINLGTLPQQRIQFAVLSPSISNPSVIFVYANNIFVQYLSDPANPIVQQVTYDGSADVLNGVHDWAYEEEIYGRTGAIWLNDDATYMAFLRFDQSAVPTYSFPLFDLPNNVNYQLKYPKVGQNNSVVSLGLYKMGDQSYELIDVDPTQAEKYIINVLWMGLSTVTTKVMPRLQTSYTLLAWDVTTLRSRVLHSDVDDWYIETDFSLTYLNKLESYVDRFAHSDRQHLALYASDGTFQSWLTSSPDWDVLHVDCVDEVHDIIYFTANSPSSIERALHAVDVKSGAIFLVVDYTGQERVMQQASFSGSCGFFTIDERAQRPLSTRLFASNFQQPDQPTLLNILSDNSAVLTRMASYVLPKRVFTTFASKVVSGQRLNAYMLLPPGFAGTLQQPDCSFKFPVLVNPYLGPGSQQVQATFGEGGNGGTGFNTYLSSSLGYIVLVVDGVGTGGKGNTFTKNYTTLHLTENEEVDVINVIDQLADFCFVDTSRVAYFGHSYGGTMATRVATSLLSQRVVPRLVIAGAPVTNWQLYDSIYTERYMRLPGSQNPTGYSSTSLLDARAKVITVPSFYLFHGTADDNVHYQNGALLAQALTMNNQQFKQFVFVNRNHGFNSFLGYGRALGGNMFYYSMLSNIFMSLAYNPQLSIDVAVDDSSSKFASADATELELAWNQMTHEELEERLGVLLVNGRHH